jgi:hypothetical protein
MRRGRAKADVGAFSDTAVLSGDSFVGTYADPVTKACDRPDDDKKPMFIKDSILVDNIEKRVIRSRNCVRLHRSDGLLGRPRDAPYQSAVAGSFKFLRCLADGKLLVVGGLPSVLDGQGVDEVVEARPKVVDDLAGQDAEAWGTGAAAQPTNACPRPSS